jgi:hypothetical protein
MLPMFVFAAIPEEPEGDFSKQVKRARPESQEDEGDKGDNGEESGSDA